MTRGSGFYSKGFTTKNSKSKSKGFRNSGSVEDKDLVQFGSSKKIRTNMEKIEKSITKLHTKVKNNWSKKDLKDHYFLNGSNFGDTYKRSTHTLFDHLKTQQSNKHLAQTTFNGTITGAPYQHQSIIKKSHHETLSRLNPALAEHESTRKLAKGTINGGPNTSDSALKSICTVLNTDQKLIYSSNRQSKYAKTNTIKLQNDRGKSYKIK